MRRRCTRTWRGSWGTSSRCALRTSGAAEHAGCARVLYKNVPQTYMARSCLTSGWPGNTVCPRTMRKSELASFSGMPCNPSPCIAAVLTALGPALLWGPPCCACCVGTHVMAGSGAHGAMQRLVSLINRLAQSTLAPLQHTRWQQNCAMGCVPAHSNLLTHVIPILTCLRVLWTFAEPRRDKVKAAYVVSGWTKVRVG